MTAVAPPHAPPGIVWRFTGRAGGFSTGDHASLNLADHVGDDPDAVAANRAAVAASLGVAADRVAVMRAAHGREVATVDAGGTVAEVDGLVTGAAGLGLLALAADCATIALADPGARLVAAVHSGWRGVAANAAGAAVAHMVAEGADAARIVAVVGPLICPGCYEVSPDVADEVAESAPDSRGRTRWGTPAVDLRAGIDQQLRAAGVLSVSHHGGCTFEAADWYSYRRDGRTGRHGMMIALLPDPDAE